MDMEIDIMKFVEWKCTIDILCDLYANSTDGFEINGSFSMHREALDFSINNEDEEQLKKYFNDDMTPIEFLQYRFGT